MAYLEISPRRVGKTTRLLYDAFNYVKSSKVKNAYILCVNKNHCETMKRDHPHFFEEERMHLLSVESLSSPFNRGYNPDKDKYYFDEFDNYIFTNLDYQELIFDNGYYVTTPRKLRLPGELFRDEGHLCLLAAILKMNDMKYTKVLPSNLNYRAKSIECHSDNFKRVELYGEFLI